MNLSFWTKSDWIKKRAETEVGKKKKKKGMLFLSRMVHFWWDLHKSQSPTEKSGQEKNEIKNNRIHKSKGINKETTEDCKAISESLKRKWFKAILKSKKTKVTSQIHP